MITLDGGGLRKKRTMSEDVSPMENVGNLVDAMLVFACGLLLALVTFWNLDLQNIIEVKEEREMTELTDVETITEEIDSSGSSYNELGMVYEDPETGKMYLITEDE